MNGNCHFVFGATVGSMIALNMNNIATVFTNINSTTETATSFVV